MQTRIISFVAALAAAGSAAGAQPSIVYRSTEPGSFARLATTYTHQAAIGVTTSTSGSERDTLGLLVVEVLRGGPAEKAGIEEGNRITAINGVNLRLSQADVGDREMAGLMGRRLNRELGRIKVGDEVDLRVYGGGQTRAVKVRSVDPSTLYATVRPRVGAGGGGGAMAATAAPVRRTERATLGVSLGANGSRRDTLGVFVMSVVEGGPAQKAGIEEGHRIAAVNGVDLRVPREDAGDMTMSSARLRRLQRAIDSLKPGDQVELRVVSGGSTRTVRATLVAAEALPRGEHGFTVYGGGDVLLPSMRVHVDGAEIGDNVRRTIERALEATGRGLEGTARVFDEIGRGLQRGDVVRW